jgi:hypothetical protein
VDPQQFEQLIGVLREARFAEVASLVILALGFVVAVASLLYARTQLLADHRRSQRQLALEMCSSWSSFTSPETSSVNRLVEKMTPDQCESVANLTQLVIDVNQKHHLLNILQLRFPDVESKLEALKKSAVYEIDGQYLLYIRHIAIRYLNKLESVLLCWTMGIADQTIIEEEFSYLFDEKLSRTAMEGLRKKVGLDGFPAIDEFMKALREKTRSGSKKIIRPPVVK